MSKDRSVYLRHILDCVNRIKAYTQDGRTVFLSDEKTQDAVIRNLEVIGQAVKDFGADRLALSFPEVPWAQIAGTRNILAHQYLGVDIELIWNIVEQELPMLETAMNRILQEFHPG